MSASYSQNGWIANRRTLVAKHFVAGTERYFVIRKGDAGTVLMDFLNWFHVNIEPLDGGIYDDWGYAERLIRGSSNSLSNHASGTAIDANATKHPLGKRGTFTPAQTHLIRERLKFYEGALRWGGDYTGRADEMHVEINRDADFVARIAKKIKSANQVVVVPPVVQGRPAPAPPSKKDYLSEGDKGVEVGNMQRFLQAVGFYSGMVDDSFGPKSDAAVKAFQVAAGFRGGDVDGVWGKDTEFCASLVPAYPGPSNQQNPQRQLHSTLLFQRRLKHRGWKIEADGWHGSGTTRVFRGYQAEKGIQIDGSGGPQLWTSIHAQPIV